MKTKTLLFLTILTVSVLLGGCFSTEKNDDITSGEVEQEETMDEREEETTEEEVEQEEQKEEEKSGDEEENLDKSMILSNLIFSEDNKSLTFTIQNTHQTESIQYGLSFDIERVGSYGEWIMTGVTDMLYFPAVLMEVPPSSEKTDVIDLSHIDFVTGTYRIIRPYTIGERRYLGYLNFSIDEFMTFDHFSSDVQ